MKILPLGAELFNADGQTDRLDETNIRFLRTRLTAVLIDGYYPHAVT
jgi:hypothetical protein